MQVGRHRSRRPATAVFSFCSSREGTRPDRRRGTARCQRACAAARARKSSNSTTFRLRRIEHREPAAKLLVIQAALDVRERRDLAERRACEPALARVLLRDRLFERQRLESRRDGMPIAGEGAFDRVAQQAHQPDFRAAHRRLCAEPRRRTVRCRRLANGALALPIGEVSLLVIRQSLRELGLLEEEVRLRTLVHRQIDVRMRLQSAVQRRRGTARRADDQEVRKHRVSDVVVAETAAPIADPAS